MPGKCELSAALSFFNRKGRKEKTAKHNYKF